MDKATQVLNAAVDNKIICQWYTYRNHNGKGPQAIGGIAYFKYFGAGLPANNEVAAHVYGRTPAAVRRDLAIRVLEIAKGCAK